MIKNIMNFVTIKHANKSKSYILKHQSSTGPNLIEEIFSLKYNKNKDSIFGIYTCSPVKHNS